MAHDSAASGRSDIGVLRNGAGNRDVESNHGSTEEKQNGETSGEGFLVHDDTPDH
jgi:hypothetical protein